MPELPFQCLQIQDDLKKVGVKVTFVPIDFNLLRERIDQTFEYEAALMGLGGGGIDPARSTAQSDRPPLLFWALCTGQRSVFAQTRRGHHPGWRI